MENRVTKKTDEERLTARAPESGVQSVKPIQSRPPSIAASLLQLQRPRGNRFTQQLLRSRVIQAKLTVSQPDDEYEREADDIADQVMRMPEGKIEAVGRDADITPPPRIQRLCSACEDEELQRRMEEGDEVKEPLRRKADDQAGGEADSVEEALRSPWQPLDSATRAFMEPRFGRDFGQVRVHTDARAIQSARSVKANAYTVGNHIVFNDGRYSPGTRAGATLLAHELTHVVQQSFGGAPALRRDEQKQGPAPSERVDVALVLDDDPRAMIEARTYASRVIRATSGEDAKNKLLDLGKKIGKKIGTIFVVSHSNSSGQVQVISGIGTISYVKLSDFSKDLKNLGEMAPQDIDFRGCKLGDAPDQMEAFRKNVGAQRARATNCWSMVKPVNALRLPDGTPITKESQITGKEKEFDEALRKQIDGLKAANGISVKDCIIGLAAGEKANGKFKRIKQLYFQNEGNLAAGWASPKFNENWQEGQSICAKDMTATTSPCKILTQTAPATGGGTTKGAMLLEPVEPSPAGDLLSASEKELIKV